MSEQKFEAGEVFAGFVIAAYLGRGGMGGVYRALHPRLRKSVALKLLTATDDEDERRRFLREAPQASELAHPNIVDVYDCGDEDGQLWISMQYIDGTDVDKELRNGAMRPARAVRIIADIAQALDCAHDAGLLHRDVKPANILSPAPEHRTSVPCWPTSG